MVEDRTGLGTFVLGELQSTNRCLEGWETAKPMHVLL